MRVVERDLEYEIKMSELPKCQTLRYPWLSFGLLILLGEWPFVKQSCQRIKAINDLREKEWEENIKKIDREKKELAEKKRQDELERRLGCGYSYPYLPLQSYLYAQSGYGQGSIYNTVSTGRPVLYNGEIVQVS